MSANDALGNSGGEETHTLTTAEMPAHTHTEQAPNALTIVQGSGVSTNITAGNLQNLTSGSAGGGGAHNNLQPYQVVNYQIKT